MRAFQVVMTPTERGARPTRWIVVAPDGDKARRAAQVHAGNDGGAWTVNAITAQPGEAWLIATDDPIISVSL